MAIIDIRKGDEPCDKIQFADERSATFLACFVEPRQAGGVRIQSADGDNISVKEEDIDNLTKALQKAKELWGKS